MEDMEKQNSNSYRDYSENLEMSVKTEMKSKKNEIEKNTVDKAELEIIEEETKNYIDDMKKGTYNILVSFNLLSQVAVRCRPLNSKEREVSNYETLRVMDRKVVILLDPYDYNGPNDIFKNRSREQNYAFDLAFEKTCSQQVVFTYATKFLIDGVVNGYNATIFAYGATGAGKTYTMLGNDEEPGIIPQTFAELFNKIGYLSNERDYKIKLWYLEIYNENIRDLLSTSEDYLDLREDPAKGIVVSGISELNVSSFHEILTLLKKGSKNRTQEATNANEASSRSHAIMQVLVEYKEKHTGIEAEVKFGKLSLIDLAGSERASATLNRGIRLIEGANINRSLLTLGNCINALCESNEKNSKNYIPYRDSKLTRLLKDSLGGNSRTVMITNVSPSVTSFEDTYNTLKYANRAKNIKTQVQRNVLSVQYHISNYVNIINNMKNEISELKCKLGRREGSPLESYQIKKDNHEKILLEKAVEDAKKVCENELAVKQKLVNLQWDMNNIKAAISKEIDSQNKNDADYSCITIKTNTYWNNTTNETSNEKSILEQKGKLKALRNECKNCVEQLRGYSLKKEQMMSEFNQNGMNGIYLDYIKTLFKSQTWKMLLIENKFKNDVNNMQNETKDRYIQELEDQIRIRDEILVSNGIKVYDAAYASHNVKSVPQLKNEYAKRLPFIVKPKQFEENSSMLSSPNISSISKSSLPPIHNLSNVNSFQNDLRDMNKKIEHFNHKDRNFVMNIRMADKELSTPKILPPCIAIKENPPNSRQLSKGVRNLNSNIMNTPISYNQQCRMIHLKKENMIGQDTSVIQAGIPTQNKHPNTSSNPSIPIIKDCPKRKGGSSNALIFMNAKGNRSHMNQSASHTLSHSSRSAESSRIEVDNSRDDSIRDHKVKQDSSLLKEIIYSRKIRTIENSRDSRGGSPKPQSRAKSKKDSGMILKKKRIPFKI